MNINKTLPRKIAVYLFDHGYTVKSFCEKTGFKEKELNFLLASASIGRKKYQKVLDSFLSAAGEGLTIETLRAIDSDNDNKKISARYKELKSRKDITPENARQTLNPYDALIFEGYPRKLFSDYSDFDKMKKVSDITSEDLKFGQEIITARKKDEIFDEKMKNQRYKRGFADVDVWNIYSWFLDIMPKMLTQLRDNLHGYPMDRQGPLVETQALAINEEDDENPGLTEWKNVLSRMIFLLQEMDEDKCSFKNPYQKEYDRASKEFEDKYGFFGCDFEKINGIESENDGSRRIYFFSDDPDHPEWKELSANWHKYEIIIAGYRDRCREEFFNLFSKWFWDLWD